MASIDWGTAGPLWTVIVVGGGLVGYVHHARRARDPRYETSRAESVCGGIFFVLTAYLVLVSLFLA